MKAPTLLFFVAGLAASQVAYSACSGTQVTGSTSPTLTTLVTGNTVCGVPGASYPGTGGAGSSDRWAEFHQSGGTLIENHSLNTQDPQETVGSWAIVADTVRYTYTGGTSFTYNLFVNGGSYSFCEATSNAEYVVGTFKTGQATCP